MYKSRFLAITILLLIFWFSANSALACQLPIKMKPSTLLERVKAADIVLEGEVLRIDKDDNKVYNGDLQKLEVQIHQYLKGSGPTTITIGGFGFLCTEKVNVNEDAIFYVRGNAFYGYKTSGAFYSNAVIEAAFPNTIAQIKSITGSEQEIQYKLWALLGLLVMGLLIIVLALKIHHMEKKV